MWCWVSWVVVSWKRHCRLKVKGGSQGRRRIEKGMYKSSEGGLVGQGRSVFVDFIETGLWRVCLFSAVGDTTRFRHWCFSSIY